MWERPLKFFLKENFNFQQVYFVVFVSIQRGGKGGGSFPSRKFHDLHHFGSGSFSLSLPNLAAIFITTCSPPLNSSNTSLMLLLCGNLSMTNQLR